jgi:hypothetical protein
MTFHEVATKSHFLAIYLIKAKLWESFTSSVKFRFSKSLKFKFNDFKTFFTNRYNCSKLLSRHKTWYPLKIVYNWVNTMINISFVLIALNFTTVFSKLKYKSLLWVGFIEGHPLLSLIQSIALCNVNQL